MLFEVMDDLVTEKHTTSPEQMMKVRHWYDRMTQQFPGIFPSVSIVPAKYHGGDLYEMLNGGDTHGNDGNDGLGTAGTGEPRTTPAESAGRA